MSEFDGRLWICATTFPNRSSAESAAEDLVGEGLVVCAQVGADLTSFYRWQGELQRQAEVAVLLKIRDDRYEAAAARLVEIHPYEVPQVLAWPADRVAPGYGRWAWEEEG